MFCPNCGTENGKDLAFCRSCGDDLKIISQAMKKHLPIVLISKLDTAIDSKVERLRRDGIFGTLFGALFTIIAVIQGFSSELLLAAGFGGFGLRVLYLGILQYLAYIRSFEIGRISKKSVDGRDSPSADQSNPESRVEFAGNVAGGSIIRNDVAQPLSYKFCPKCGAENFKKLPYCTACGSAQYFDLVPQGLEKYLPKFIVSKVDAQIAKKDQELELNYKNRWALIFSISFFLSYFLIAAMEGRWASASIWLFSALFTLIAGAWDFAAYRRLLEAEKIAGKIFPVSVVSELFEFLRLPKNFWTSLTAVIILFSSVVLAFFTSSNLVGGGIFFSAIILLAQSINFYSHYSNRKRIFLNEVDAFLGGSNSLPEDVIVAHYLDRRESLAIIRESTPATDEDTLPLGSPPQPIERADSEAKTKRGLTPVENDDEIGRIKESESTSDLVEVAKEEPQTTEFDTKGLTDSR